jgi:hypothetical protein
VICRRNCELAAREKAREAEYRRIRGGAQSAEGDGVDQAQVTGKNSRPGARVTFDPLSMQGGVRVAMVCNRVELDILS